MKKGFTLLEMIVVLSVITVVFLLTLPNIQQKRVIINEKGCSALVEVVNAQILLYQLEEGVSDVSIDDLIEKGYLKAAQSVCPTGERIEIQNGQAVLP